MATKDSDDIVYFQNPDGTRFSNDPRWVAAQAAGMAFPDNSSLSVKEEDEEPMEEEPSPYDGMTAKELKAEVASRNEDRDEADQLVIESGMKKSQVVAMLEADDEAHKTDEGSEA